MNPRYRPTCPDVLVVEEAAPLTNSPGGQKCCNRIIRQGRKSQTGFVGISQHPIKDFAVLEDEFIDQRLCLAFKDSGWPGPRWRGAGATWTATRSCCATTWRTPARRG